MSKYLTLTLLSLLLLNCNKNAYQHSDEPLTKDQLIKKYNYNWISEFSEGKALVYNDKQCYVIDEYGKKLFDFPYMGSEFNFTDNYAVIHQDYYEGVIDHNGEVIVQPDYLRIRKACPEINYAKTKNLKEGYLDITSNTFYKNDSLSEFPFVLTPKLIYNKKDGKVGLIDREGNTIIPYEYNRLNLLNSGGIAVQKGNKYGIINEKNEILTPFIYDKITQEKNNDVHIIVSLNGKKGIIDENNQILLPIEYDHLIETNYRQLKFKKGEENGWLDKNLNPITEDKVRKNPSYDSSEYFTTFENNGKKGIRSVEGKVLHEAIFDEVSRYNQIQIRVKKDGLENMLNEKGEILFSEYYDRMHGVGDFVKIKKNDLWGVKTKWDKTIIDIAYKNIEIKNDLIITNNGGSYGGSYGLFDYNGVERLKTEYREIIPYKNVIIANGKDSCMVLSKNFKKLFESEGAIRTFKFQDNDYLVGLVKNYKVYLVDLQTNKISKKAYSSLSEIAFLKNHFRVSSEMYKGVMDNNENLILDTIYTKIEVVNTNKNYIRVIGPKGVGLFNIKFKQVIPAIYGDLVYKTDNLIIARKKGLAGVLDINEHIVIPFKYSSIKEKIENFYIVVKDKKYGLIDSTENNIIDFEYEEITSYNYPLFKVKKDNQWGLININSEEILPIEFEEIQPCMKELAIVKKESKYGMMNNQGEILIPSICDKVICKYLYRPEKRINYFIVNYKDYEFKLNPDLKCIENCPPDEVLLELNLERKN